MKEEWRDVKGYEGKYQVSNMGDVRSLDRINNIGRFVAGRVLKKTVNSGGYYWVKLCSNGIEKSFAVHTLVAMSFLDFDASLVVDHINNEKLDNRLCNLQMISHRLNCSKDVLNKTSRFTGVSWSRNRNKWHSKIKIKGKTINLGRFDCELAAAYAYNMKVIEINERT